MRRRLKWPWWNVFLLAAVGLWTAGTALADGKGSSAPAATSAAPADQSKTDAAPGDKLPDVPALEPEPDHPKTGTSATKRDPVTARVTAAFAPPHGTTLTTIQSDKLKKLKDKMEPGLKTALEKLDKLAPGPDKTAAALAVRTMTKDIKAKVQDIVDTPDPTQQNKMPQQQQRYQPPYPNNRYPNNRYY